MSMKKSIIKLDTDYDRVMEVFFNDIFDGNMGKITWELPNGTL